MELATYPLSVQLGKILTAGKKMLALAESCTGGGIAHEITRVPGSADWLDRGFVTYSNEAKIEQLGVQAKSLKDHGAVSEVVAREMALGALKNSRADIALSVTGIAGPTGGSKEKPVGLVYFGLARKNHDVQCLKAVFTSGRGYVRACTVAYALQWLIKNLQAK